MEILVSLALFSVAALGVVAAMTRLMFAQGSSSHQTVASILADSKLQAAILAFGPTTPLGIIDKGSTDVRVGQHDEPTPFHYEVSATEMPKSGSIASGRTMGKLYQFTATVYWNSDDSGPQAAVERGTQTVTITRIAYRET